MSSQESVHPRDVPTRRFDVTIVGDTNLDLLMYGLPEDLPSERELLASGMTTCIGGSGAITAHNLAALGKCVGFITAAAPDEFGRFCRNELQSAKVDMARAIDCPDRNTGVTVHLQHHMMRHMFTHAGATFQLRFEDLDLGYLAASRHFHIPSYYLQRALTPRIPELLASLKRSGLTISLDPNDDPSQLWHRSILDALRFVDILMPNEREACLIAGKPDLRAAVAFLRTRVPLLIVKQGQKGASAYEAKHEWHIAAEVVQVKDAVGAGDSFNAAFLHAWLSGWPVERALAFANAVGAFSTTASGGTAAFRDAERLNRLLASWAVPIPQHAGA